MIFESVPQQQKHVLVPVPDVINCQVCCHWTGGGQPAGLEHRIGPCTLSFGRSPNIAPVDAQDFASKIVDSGMLGEANPSFSKA